MSKFCQHPDCPNSAENPGPCSLCGFPKKRVPKVVDALHLTGYSAVWGFFLAPASAMIPVVLSQAFPSIHRNVVQSLALLIFVIVAALVPFAVLKFHEKDVNLMSRTLDPATFQSEVNKALKIGTSLAVIGGASTVSAVFIYLALSNSRSPVFPGYIFFQVAVSAIIPASICMFIYSKQLRAVRASSETRSGGE